MFISTRFPYSPYLPTFRSYLDLIDLTKDIISEESNRDDESTLPEFSLTTADRSGLVV